MVKFNCGETMNFPLTLITDFLYFILSFGVFYLTVASFKFFGALIASKLNAKPAKAKPKAKRKRRPAAIRSIEINPDEVDRIYVKKIS